MEWLHTEGGGTPPPPLPQLMLLSSLLVAIFQPFWAQGPPEATSEHLNFKFFLGGTPPDPPRGHDPTFPTPSKKKLFLLKSKALTILLPVFVWAAPFLPCSRDDSSPVPAVAGSPTLGTQELKRERGRKGGREG